VIVLRADGGLTWANERARTTIALDGDLARLATAEGAVSRLRLPAPDGAERVVDVAAAPIGSRAGGTVLVLQDVTERDRVERADAEFVQNAAHQLRTPITAIASSVAALEAGAAKDETERERFLDHIARASTRMGNVVDSLLMLSALQRGDRPEPTRRVIPLRAVLDAARAADPGVACFTIDCSEHLGIVGDRELLTEAIENVVTNACHHATTEVRIVATCDGDSVTVDVSDDGPGVAGDARERVFERFYRADHTSPGSGLGLPIARAAVEASGGTLELLDRPEPGATFRFHLPGATVR
jgi:signal transduction histidine kinase